MSEYQNVVGGRLKLKGKPLDVKEGGVKKKKKKKHHHGESSQIQHGQVHQGGRSELLADPNNELSEADKTGEEENPQADYDHLTPAERRYIEQKQKIDVHKLAKVADKSHRDRHRSKTPSPYSPASTRLTAAAVPGRRGASAPTSPVPVQAWRSSRSTADKTQIPISLASYRQMCAFPGEIAPLES